MSASNRGTKRTSNDLYASPSHVTHRLLDERDLDGGPLFPGGRWLEPGAGRGDIICATNMCRGDIVWSGAEIQTELEPILDPLCPGGLYMGDFLGMPEDTFGPEKFELCLGNPPYLLALEFLQKCMRMARRTAFLLRVGFWESAERHAFLSQYPPDTYILPQRPTFALNKHGRVATDATTYAWLVFRSFEEYELYPQRAGHIKILGLTSKEERSAWNRKLKADHLAGVSSARLESSLPSELPAPAENPQ